MNKKNDKATIFHSLPQAAIEKHPAKSAMTSQECSSSLFDKTTSLAHRFESIASTVNDNTSSSGCYDDDSPLVSPLIIFNTGTILYEAEPKLEVKGNDHDKGNHGAKAEADYDAQQQHYKFLVEAFYELLAHLNRDYLSQVIFHEINAAFISVVSEFLEEFRSSPSGLSGGGTLIAGKVQQQHQYQIQSLLKSIRALRGILNALAASHYNRNGENSNYSNKDREKICLIQYAFDEKLCNQLAMLYDALFTIEGGEESTYTDSTTTRTEETKLELKECILNSLSSLLLYGLISPKSITTMSEDETIQQVMEVIQGLAEHSTTTSFCLGDLQSWQEKKQKMQMQQYNENGHHRPILQIIQPMFSNEVIAQKEYLISVLKSAPQFHFHRQDHISQGGGGEVAGMKLETTSNNTQKKNYVSTTSALDRLIQQLRAIFPDLGEGYIEAALACYNHDIEQTTNALMESEANPKFLHPRLRVLDKSLPARRKESKKKYDLSGGSGNGDGGDGSKIDEEEREAMEIQKARIKEMVSAQEEEAYKLGVAMAMNDIEYNDDYDDQYDGIGDDGGATGGIGGADTGLYDMDFESIRTYNKVAKEVESDRIFWEENRNTNRSQKGYGGGGGNKKKKGDDEEDDGGGGTGSDSEDDGKVNQKKFRGPDKGKGGRIIGPDGKYLPHPKSRKKGGKAIQSNATTSASTAPTKKKNDNQKESRDGKGNTNSQQLSKAQKRRKNDNKAKIANHHRKERALKKSGM